MARMRLTSVDMESIRRSFSDVSKLKKYNNAPHGIYSTMHSQCHPLFTTTSSRFKDDVIYHITSKTTWIVAALIIYELFYQVIYLGILLGNFK